MTLPDLFLHDVATLKSVEFIGWYPKEEFTLPPGCELRLVLVLEDARSVGTVAEKGVSYVNAVPGLHKTASLAQRDSGYLGPAVFGAPLLKYAGPRPGSTPAHPTCLFKMQSFEHIPAYQWVLAKL